MSFATGNNVTAQSARMRGITFRWMDGFLSIDKPAGWTSHDVVGYIRKSFRTKRVGHAGTLDPDATGVLLVAVGSATRLLPYVQTEPKIYIASAAFGIATTTEDASGIETARESAAGLTAESITAVLPRFIGDIEQIPPMVSAVHHNGQRLYDLARKGITVERAARTIHIFDIKQDDFTSGDVATCGLTISCGTGTYIRTLCVDIGAAVGLPAHMATLRRIQVGPHTADGSVPPEQATEAHLRPMADLLPEWPRLACDDAALTALSFGRELGANYLDAGACSPVVAGDDAAHALGIGPSGDIVALLKATPRGTWQPIRVFLDVEGSPKRG
jgi:tRNA pseudouridine55 synthase